MPDTPFPTARYIAARAHDEMRAAEAVRDAVRRCLLEIEAAGMTVEPVARYEQSDLRAALAPFAELDPGRAYDLAEARLRAAETEGAL